MKLLKLYFCLLLTAFSLISCKNKKDDEKIIPLQKLYKDGIALIESKKYAKAAKVFGEIFYQHPGNEATPRSEIMQAYAHFKAAEYDDAIDALNTFIILHPSNEDIAYVYYLKALCYYMEISNIKLDQSRTVFARESFEEVISKFPGTKYAIDSALKIDLVNDHLAGKEMEVGRYYLNKKNPISAIKRFQNVVDNYKTTSHITEALYRLTESYALLGLIDDAKKYAAVLGYNYPESRWYKLSFDLINKIQK